MRPLLKSKLTLNSLISLKESVILFSLFQMFLKFALIKFESTANKPICMPLVVDSRKTQVTIINFDKKILASAFLVILVLLSPGRMFLARAVANAFQNPARS